MGSTSIKLGELVYARYASWSHDLTSWGTLEDLKHVPDFGESQLGWIYGCPLEVAVQED